MKPMTKYWILYFYTIKVLYDSYITSKICIFKCISWVLMYITKHVPRVYVSRRKTSLFITALLEGKTNPLNSLRLCYWYLNYRLIWKVNFSIEHSVCKLCKLLWTMWLSLLNEWPLIALHHIFYITVWSFKTTKVFWKLTYIVNRTFPIDLIL